MAEFDEKFEGYWRGKAIPDEIKFFISSHFTALLESLEKEIENWQYKYDSYMTMMNTKKNFEKGKMARELASDILQIINNYKIR